MFCVNICVGTHRKAAGHANIAAHCGTVRRDTVSGVCVAQCADSAERAQVTMGHSGNLRA